MHKHTIDLLERLLMASEEGRIQWTEVAGKTAYSYLAGDFVVLVDASSERTTFRLTDVQGRSLEQAGIDDLAAATLGTGVSALSAVQGIHAIARHQAMGTDMAIAAVLDHLQGLGAGSGQGDVPALPVPEFDETQSVSEEESEQPGDTVEAAMPAQTGDDVARLDNAEQDKENERGGGQGENTADEPPVETPIEMSVAEHESSAKHDKKHKRSLLNPFGGKH